MSFAIRFAIVTTLCASLASAQKVVLINNAHTYVFDFVTKNWTQKTDFCPLTDGGARCGVASLDGLVYVVGRLINERLVDVYDPSADKWSASPNMTTGRDGHGVATCQGKLYAIGGRDSDYKGALASGEAYSPKTKTWSPMSAMHEKRAFLGLAAVADHLYAVGGADQSPYNSSKASVERYDPKTDKWTVVSPMKTARHSIAVAVENGLLYAIGGSTGDDALKSGEVYDAKKDKWTPIADMAKSRSDARAVSIGGQIYVAGGISDFQLDSVEVFNPKTGKWTTTTIKLPEPMFAFGLTQVVAPTKAG